MIDNNKNNKQNLSLGDLLLTLRRSIIEKLRKVGLNKELTFSQMEVISFIGPNGMKTMREIAEYLKITPPSTTEIITDMEKQGFIKRKSNKQDRRIVYIELSGNTKKLYVKLSKHKELVLKKMTSKLGSQDKKTLERIIRIIIKD